MSFNSYINKQTTVCVYIGRLFGARNKWVIKLWGDRKENQMLQSKPMGKSPNYLIPTMCYSEQGSSMISMRLVVARVLEWTGIVGFSVMKLSHMKLQWGMHANTHTMCSTERGPTVHYTLLVNDTVGHWLIKCDKRAKTWVKVSHSSPGAQTPPSPVTPKFTHGAVGKNVIPWGCWIKDLCFLPCWPFCWAAHT